MVRICSHMKGSPGLVAVRTVSVVAHSGLTRLINNHIEFSKDRPGHKRRSTSCGQLCLKLLANADPDGGYS